MRRLLGIFVVLMVLRRLLGIFVVLVALTGCGESGVLDFFESGFADDEADDDEDDGDNGDNGDNGDLTEGALAGEWDIDPDTSTTVLIGRWKVIGTVDATFLAGVGLQEPATVTQLEISEESLVFSNNIGATLGRFDFEILIANQLRLISVTPPQSITAMLNSDGTGLTLTDIDETSEAMFVIDEDGTPVITEYVLSITAGQFTSTITSSDGDTETPETIIETFTITNNSTIRLTGDSSTPIDVQATLSNDNNILTLVFPPTDLHRRGTAVFEQ